MKSQPKLILDSEQPRHIRRKYWLLRKRKRVLRHRRRAKRNRNAGISVEPYTNEQTKNSVKRREGRLEIALPVEMDLEKNYETTVSHLAAIRKATKLRRRLKSLKFNRLKYISPSAALVLASEMDRWNQRLGGGLRADVDSWQPDIRRLLAQMGYFELLGLERPQNLETKNTTFLPFKRGIAHDPHSNENHGGGELAKQLRIEIEELTGASIQRHFLFEGLSEAITNVGQHAYSDGYVGALRQWWVSASYDREDSVLCVTFYDQGDGIPVTLPNNEFFDLIRHMFDGWSDSFKIGAAMEIGNTATRRAERGKGLQNFVEFAKAHRWGRLSIYSLTGLYRMNWKMENGAQEFTDQREDFENSIGGTLIEWQVKLA